MLTRGRSMRPILPFDWSHGQNNVSYTLIKTLWLDEHLWNINAVQIILVCYLAERRAERDYGPV